MFTFNNNFDINGKSYRANGGTGIGKYKEVPTNNYKKLFEKTICYLSEYLNYFSCSDFDTLIKKLDKTQISILGKKIYNLQKDIKNSTESKFKEKLRLFLKKVLIALQNGIFIYNKLKTCEKSVETLKERTKILDDMDLLREYIQELNSSFDILGGVNITASKATIKEEYQIYIDRHGFPCNGIFDPDLMNNIMLELGL